jgi:hypothetical protein
MSCSRRFLFQFGLATYFVSLFPMSHQVRAADNELTAEEQAAGWQLLFNGKDLNGWKNNDDKPLAPSSVQDGTLNPHGAGGYLVVYDKQFGDFELSCDLKMSAEDCNSGIFFRISDLADPIYTSLEAQVLATQGATHQDMGAIYDLVAPKMACSQGPGRWHNMKIRCQGPLVEIRVNGEKVAELNCDELDQPGKRADGSEHKFRRAIKDFARSGYIGFQDHGQDVWFKNIKLREL